MRNTTSVSQQIFTETECITDLLHYAVANQFSIAVWRLPNESVRHLIVSRKHSLLKRDAALEELEPGFIFAPFDRSKDSTFLRADLKFSFDSGLLNTPENPAEISAHTWLQQEFEHIRTTSKSSFHWKPVPPDHTLPYAELVQICIDELEDSSLEKIVPSRKKIIDLPESFDVVQAFQDLCDRYPHALVSFVSSPESGSWLGATPEVLVSVEDKTIFRTVALAGTQAYHEGVNLKTVAWTQKEIEEQALVERYVISCFKKIRVREYDEQGPKTIVAGNLLHLKSEFTVNMKDINFPQLGSVMLQLLHPTSAVCGMPLAPALDFLQKHEGYDRQYYAGFLGPVNVENNINIFVNLRCMQLVDSKAILYAGAGVTVDSIPEHEFAETEIKFKTLLSVIEK